MKKGIGCSSYDREDRIQILKKKSFDLVIIGGGVTGAGIALDASSRGLKTALIEKSDFASGTSSKSTKLIHGGLRYLKQFDISLVRESGTERAVVNELAPHLCLPEKMLLPIIVKGTFGKFSTSIGLKVYDWIAGVEKEDSRRMLNKEETLKEEPLLNSDVLRGSGLYAEYRTDDARLTIELLKKAASFGAVVCNYVQANDFINDDGKLVSITCQDKLTGDSFAISSTKFIAAAGPWVDQIRQKNDKTSKKQLYLTKGVHIVIPKHRLPINNSIYFDVPDGRMIFAIPRGNTVYIGTTDTEFHGNKNRVVATKADRDYLLKATNYMFPASNLTRFDVISSWSGLRPLIKEEGKSPSEVSRKDEIFVENNGLLSIAGGKLTGYRKMAERIVDLAIQQMGKEGLKVKGESMTKEIRLTPDPFDSNAEVKTYIDSVGELCREKGLEAYVAEYLVTTYGKQSHEILSNLKTGNQFTPQQSLVLAELDFCLKSEMIQRLDDFFIRRTAKLFFDIHQVNEVKELACNFMSEKLGWKAKRQKAEMDRLNLFIADASTFYDNDVVESLEETLI